MYISSGVTPYTLPSSPSFQANNLSADKDAVCYIQNSNIFVADSSGEICKLPGLLSQIYQTAFVTISAVSYLVVLSDQGVQVWTSEGVNMVYSFPIEKIWKEAAPNIFYLCGIASCGNCLTVGTSTGEIMVFDLSSYKPGEMDYQHLLESGKTAITSLGASPMYLAAGNEVGEIFVYNSEDAFLITTKFVLDASNLFVSCVTSLLVSGEVLVAGYTSGHIRIFRINISEMAVEVTAHFRSVTGLTLNTNCAYFASCSDDQLVQVWSWPTFESKDRSQTDLLFSHKLENRVLTGVAFLSDDKLAVAAYDDMMLTIFRRE